MHLFLYWGPFPNDVPRSAVVSLLPFNPLIAPSFKICIKVIGLVLRWLIIKKNSEVLGSFGDADDSFVAAVSIV